MALVKLSMEPEMARRILRVLDSMQIRGLESAEVLILLATGLQEGIKETEEIEDDG